METPTLYVKRGCPYCLAATKYLDQHNVQYQQVEVRGEPAKMENLRVVSGQSKTPTLVCNGAILADFGTEELAAFLTAHAPLSR